MQVRQFNELEAARRAYTFLTSTPLAPPLANMPTTFTQQVQALGATISQIDTEASAQTAATGAITDKVAATNEAAKELHSSHLSPIKKVAKLLVQGSTGGSLSPSFADSITVPNAQNHAALLSASTATAQLVTPYKDLFTARGLPTDFLDQLSAQATVLSQSMQASGVAKTTRASTTTELKQLFQELRSTMHVLEIGVTKACKADRANGPTTMTAWKNAKTIRKTATPTDIPFTPPAVVPTPTPASASTSASTPTGTSTITAITPSNTTVPTPSDTSATSSSQGAAHA
jgi:hypothetical protein